MKKVNGSLTVEAALVFPVMLMLFAGTMRLGIELFEECKEEAYMLQQEEIDAAKLFRERITDED